MSGASNLSDRDRVLDATDLAALIGEHLSLRPKGRESVALCPFHDDRSPSLAVVTHKGNGFYKCFACGASGNAIDFVMEYLKLDFPSALKMLAERAGIALTERAERREAPDDREAVALANRLALRFYRRALAGDEAEAARAAIAAREFPESIVESFQLGYAPDRRDALQQNLKAAERHARESGSPPPPPLAAFNAAGLVRDARSGGAVDLLRHRLVFPILDEFGRCIAFGGRKLRDEDEPKYLNSPESPIFHKSRSLYGIHAAKRAIIERGTAIVTEGYTDVIACHAAGVTNAVATLGTALTRDHARVLRRLCTTVVLLFDGDEAGMRAADRAVEVFMAEPVDVKICTLPDGEDPDEVLRRPGGRAIFDAAIAAAAPALEYLVRRHAREYRGRDGLSSRQASLEALLRRLADLGFDRMNGVRRGFVLASLSDLTGLPVREIEKAVPAAAKRAGEPRAEATPPAEEPGDTDLPPQVARAERDLLALVLGFPELVREGVSIEGGPPRPLLETVPSPSLGLAVHRDILGAIAAIAGRDRLPSPAETIGECRTASAKRLVGELGLVGSALAADASAARPLLAEAVAALDAARRRDRFRRGEPVRTDPAARPDPDPAPDAPPELASALDRLRRLKERGPDIAVVPRVAGPPSPHRATG
jgi:DNA primase